MSDSLFNLDGVCPPTFKATEFKIITLRECLSPLELQMIDTPQKAADYWRSSVVTNPAHNPEVETLVVLLLNTRRKIKGHHLVSTGTLDTILAHPREIFRAAIIGAASAIVLMHNHPSGDPTTLLDGCRKPLNL